MKYATVMATGLFVHMSIFASDILPTEDYANLTGEKVRILKQLGEHAECIRLADNEQALRDCQEKLSQHQLTQDPLARDPSVKQRTARNIEKLKTDNPNQNEFF
ncbi:hypothetical protein ACFQ1T_08630 [Methylophilus glucosoxydans]|uniref:Secreted protein n=1 Tax=Methylophilus glucosoxydans TaxID=752553 RepID=A0ABW3GIF9_9PROT|nr:hypothetical protein [Methylophilus sp. 13]MBF5039004.1 hypothetical protein [Methylophilus sp. 13]BEV08441.1 hypothetical protein MTDW_17410 [Methylophilus sp. DW102]